LKIKTNLRAGAKSGTAARGGSGGGGKSSSTDSTSVSTPDVVPVVVYTRCAGL